MAVVAEILVSRRVRRRRRLLRDRRCSICCRPGRRVERSLKQCRGVGFCDVNGLLLGDLPIEASHQRERATVARLRCRCTGGLTPLRSPERRIDQFFSGTNGIFFCRCVVERQIAASDGACHRSLHRAAIGKHGVWRKRTGRGRAFHVRQEFIVRLRQSASSDAIRHTTISSNTARTTLMSGHSS